MAWEWSHTPEAYTNALRNLEDMPRSELEVIAKEIMSTDRESYGPNLDLERYDSLDLSDWLTDDIVSYIWDFMATERTCTNGGWKAYACPYGCNHHLIPFDRDED